MTYDYENATNEELRRAAAEGDTNAMLELDRRGYASSYWNAPEEEWH